ncbi:MAG: 4'-phosphopantetheinyl transferase superfamily protein [Gammaproteobacteria bacterium]|nr:4'-phosphopantetheinyl transferase superfamily protein [Gammaproteobacteria bacterium]
MNGNWQTPPDDLGISPRHVDIWLTSTKLEEAQVRAYAKYLSQAELARAQKFRSKTGYREYIVTRGLLRQVMSETAGLDLAGVDFMYGEHGKPWLDARVSGRTVAFNVSHSHGLALVALTVGGRLGVDLEKVRPEVEWEDLAGRYFAEAEIRALENRPQGDGLKAFYACWTRKEAFVKALGAGVSYGLEQFDVSVDPDEDYAALTIRGKDEDAAGWLVKNLPVPDSHAAALAVDRPACKFRFWRAGTAPFVTHCILP